LTNGTLWNQNVSTQQKKWLPDSRGCPRNGRKIFASYISNKRLIMNFQGAQKTKLPKNQWPNEEIDRDFSREEVQMAKNHIKKCSTTLAIKEIQIKIMLRFHLTLVKMAIIKNTKSQVLMAHAYNSSYSGGRDQKDRNSKLV
jgi:hypothetical protein